MPAEHKCARLHGHSFAVRISVAGDVHNDTGWVMDFSDVSAAFKPLLKRPDPHYLNEVDDLGNRTSENLAPLKLVASAAMATAAIRRINTVNLCFLLYPSEQLRKPRQVDTHHGKHSSSTGRTQR